MAKAGCKGEGLCKKVERTSKVRSTWGRARPGDAETVPSIFMEKKQKVNAI